MQTKPHPNIRSDQNALAALAALPSPNEDVAREGLEYLADDCRRTVERFLVSSCRVENSQTRSDVTQSVLLRVWANRGSFVPSGLAAWRQYLRRAAYHCFVDHLRVAGRFVTDDVFDIHNIPRHERPILESLLCASEVGLLMEMADVLFLKLDRNATTAAHKYRLLAAQIFYLERQPWQKVIRLIGTPPPGESQLTRESLDEWLCHPGVLRHLAFVELFWDGNRLTRYLREQTASDPTDEREGEETEGGSAAEACVIAWRFQHTLLIEQILSRDDCRLTRAEVLALCDRCVALFPFEREMKRIRDAVQSQGVHVTSTFSDTGLWQRLAFEYRYRGDLPHRDILDRIAPPAQVVNVKVTSGMLNVWLSNGRLLQRLGQFWNERFADSEGMAPH